MRKQRVVFVTTRQGFKLLRRLFKLSPCKKKRVEIKVVPSCAELDELTEGLEKMKDLLEKVKRLTVINGKPRKSKRR